MKLHVFLSSLLSLCCVCPLLAEDLDADHADVKIDPMPNGWDGANSAPGTFFAMHTVNDDVQMFQVNSSPHSENFQKFCEHWIAFSTDGVALEDMKKTDPHPAKVGPSGTIEFDITGKNGDTHRHIHVYLMPVRKTFAVIKCECDQPVGRKRSWSSTRWRRTRSDYRAAGCKAFILFPYDITSGAS